MVKECFWKLRKAFYVIFSVNSKRRRQERLDACWWLVRLIFWKFASNYCWAYERRNQYENWKQSEVRSLIWSGLRNIITPNAMWSNRRRHLSVPLIIFILYIYVIIKLLTCFQENVSDLILSVQGKEEWVVTD